MKALFDSFLLAGVFLFVGCAKDNVEPPSSNLTGRVIYQDQPVGVRTNGVQLELWQYGYQLRNKIPVYVAQDGSFSATLFDGDYKLVRLRGNGPWLDNTDSIDVQVRGNTTVDVPVQPYYTVRNATFRKDGNKILASCQVSRATGSRTIESVTLFVNPTQFVDTSNNLFGNTSKSGTALGDLTQPVALEVALPATARNVCYARIGVRTQGVSELFYSPVQKIEF